MSHLSISRVSSCDPIYFLEHYPYVTDALLADCNYDREEVIEIISGVLQAPKRCQIATSYVQAVATGQATFLVTNFNRHCEPLLLDIASTWLIGRDSTCAIAISHSSVSPCHAVIGYNPTDSFYMADVGSSYGTMVNRRRLIPRERRTLKDGDLLQFGELQVEFFLASRKQRQSNLYEATYY
jgi:FHA domain